jgi:hypothetical protein
MKFSLLLVALTTLQFVSAAQAADSNTAAYSEYFKLTGRCTGDEGKYIRNGRNGQDIKPSLKAISMAAGKKVLSIYSCFRSQDRQNAILKSRGCAPYGSRNCSQSVARVSYHTRTIAADITQFADNRSQCNAIAKGRSVAGGVGGVGTYPGGDGHFDMGPTRSWNRCAGIVGNGDGGHRSPAAQRYRERQSSSPGQSCYRTARYPSCCGPVRASRGLCHY